ISRSRSRDPAASGRLTRGTSGTRPPSCCFDRPSASPSERHVKSFDPAKSRVVLVGTPSYSDPDLPDVPVITRNIADLQAVFTDPELGGFDPAHCVAVPPDATVAQIGTALVGAAAEAEDLLLFYYCGHGLVSSQSFELYLSVAETRHN